MDINSFEKLYKTYQPGLVNFAYYYLKNDQEAIDTVQELFLNIWEKKETFPITDNPKAYLMTAVKNRCYNKLSRDKLLNSNETLKDIFISTEETSSYIETKETEKSIHDSIQMLPEKCKEIFMLSRFDHLNYKQIAQVLDISVKTVENQISNALKVLRKNLR